MHRCSERIL